jgi:hypothetical protein
MIIKSSIARIINQLGYNIERVIPPKNMIEAFQEPGILNYINQNSIIAKIKIELIREQHLGVDYKSDPLVSIISKCVKNNYSKETLIELLREYYLSYQPKTALELFHLDIEDAPGLSRVKPWAAPYPWVENSIENWTNRVMKVTREENLRNGVDLTIMDGVHSWGPVTEEKLSIEVERFHNLLTSINNDGYTRNDNSDGDVLLDALCGETGEWRYINRGGTHRFSVLAAIGKKTITARVKSLVYRSESSIWPNVTSNMFTKVGALKLFDRYYSGTNPNFDWHGRT